MRMKNKQLLNRHLSLLYNTKYQINSPSSIILALVELNIKTTSQSISTFKIYKIFNLSIITTIFRMNISTMLLPPLIGKGVYRGLHFRWRHQALTALSRNNHQAMILKWNYSARRYINRGVIAINHRWIRGSKCAFSP